MLQPPIPKLLRHIWIGPSPAPQAWMQTWIDLHPDWQYQLFDNNALANTKFRTKRLIDRYMSLQFYSGVADLIRYELLFADGGFIASADAVCLRPVDELLTRSTCYTAFENEFVRGKLVYPILACEPGNEFVGELIRFLENFNPDDVDFPWKTTGNLFVAKMIEELKPDIVIFPSHYFSPIHFEGIEYQGSGPVYACEMFGSTRSEYPNSLEARRKQETGLLARIRRKIINRTVERKRGQLLHDFQQRKMAVREMFFEDAFSRLKTGGHLVERHEAGLQE